MGEAQEPEALDEGEFGQEPGDGDEAPESPDAPAETGEGEEGEGAGEGEGSGKKSGWSKDQAQITRLQQERKALSDKLEAAEKKALTAEARAELSRRASSRAEPREAPESDEDRAASVALNRIIQKELGMDLKGLKSHLGSLKGNLGNTSIAAADATFRADPDSYPFYGELRDTLVQYAREQGVTDPQALELAYMKLERPLLKRERVREKAERAKARGQKRQSFDSAPLPGGGRAGGGEQTVSVKDLNDPSKVSDDDLRALIEDSEVTGLDDRL